MSMHIQYIDVLLWKLQYDLLITSQRKRLLASQRPQRLFVKWWNWILFRLQVI